MVPLPNSTFGNLAETCSNMTWKKCILLLTWPDKLWEERKVSQKSCLPIGYNQNGTNKKENMSFTREYFFIWFVQVLQYFIVVILRQFVLRFFKTFKYEKGNEIHLLPRVLNLLVKSLMQVAYHLVTLTAFFGSSVLIFSGMFLCHCTFC